MSMAMATPKSFDITCAMSYFYEQNSRFGLVLGLKKYPYIFEGVFIIFPWTKKNRVSVKE